MSVAGPPKRLYTLLGDPVLHSLSPALHNAALAELGIDATYVALRVTGPLVGAIMREVASSGGGGNITLPHKRRAAIALDHASEATRVTGACNIFWWDETRGLCGDNTDIEAFRVAAESLIEADLGGRRVLLLGAGGAARAVVYACVKSGVASIDVLNRTRERAESLVRDLARPAAVNVVTPAGPLAAQGYDLIVNATSLGLRISDPLPLDLGLTQTGAVLDLVYSAEETRFVRAARAAGLKAADGLQMLVEQAAAAFAIWFNREPPRNRMYEVVGLQTR